MIERRTVFRAALGAGSAGLLAACSGGTTAGTPHADPAQLPPEATISVDPAVDAQDVPVLQPVKVTAKDGALTEVALTNADGGAVKGEFNADRTEWTSTEPLGYGRTYTYSAKAKGGDNKVAELTGSFGTVTPAREVRATLNPIDDAQVGVAMPISVKFAEAISDRAAAQRALKVETTPEVEGAWAWLSDRQVDWRPKEYWPAGTQVNVTAKLYGVHYGGGAYGKADVTTRFTIGRNQVVKIHTPDHRMRVYRDGTEFANYPCSNGRDDDPNLNTPNGTVIVMTKEPTSIFDNERYGYTNVKKKWCCRISNHGEYIHENEENRANIGKKNTSHGCVNLFEADAKAYFDSALIGDPVEVTGSKASFPTTSDVMDWLLDWETWKSKSAL
ncbi:lipoprotein-anchoring transpeptidase ErfK/SrfK [Prauserella shujinwangii]|uniref:Lipoprotein-anchoring transpeptidase ErfK/SrfK n=1 Tax=Prauserella shujinwangii TaxID=1453103 RepID=A0A2T0LQ98_9PSEU|nr:Ig-like domain-containing protein [Prauserella shujinwangii]PRX45527.1 lipoprotein-anchoring transpeptidase ErfK/SrfK [Prauserella shujinwangii]